MYLETIQLINRAPLENIKIDFLQKGVNVLSAINGKGKTTILSYIVDAFYEMTRPHYENSYEGVERKLYRVSSHLDVLNRSDVSIVYLRFRSNDEKIDYIDCRGSLSKELYDQFIILDDKIPFATIEKKLKDNNNVKFAHKIEKKKVLSIFGNNLMTYFPAYRYEQPGYLNDPYKVKLRYKTDANFSGYLRNPIEVITGMDDIVNWFMDVVLDGQLYKDDKKVQYLRNSLNQILRNVLRSKLNDNIRFGLGRRTDGGARVSVTNLDGNVIYPSIFSISSGEAAALCIFGELLRQADNIRKLNDIPGIVLIDEVDKHLHIKLQKEILPTLFNLFPNIQFIVSSHSPFLSMGLAEVMPSKSRIIDLDNNGFVCMPQTSELYQEVYNLMLTENNRYLEKYNQLCDKIKDDEKTLIITEGETDIIHINKAKEMLAIDDVDYEIIESGKQPKGESNLLNLLKQHSLVTRKRKIIGIFDRDSNTTIKALSSDSRYKDFGNNVYAFCIEAPKCRVEKQQLSISIEYLYSDVEIQTFLPNGCRLFFGTEFTQNSMIHNTDNTLSLSKPDGKGKDKVIENNGSQAVYRNNENILAKKVDFAEAIKNNEINISKESWDNFKHIFDILKEIEAK